MATPIAASLTAEDPSTHSLARRLLIFLIGRRVAVSMVLFACIIISDIFIVPMRPRNIANVMNPFVATGLLLVLFGLIMRSWAAGTLRKVKRLATTGPYAVVRNPLYVGSFLMMLGFCTLVNDPHTIWVVLGPMFGLYWLAVRDEEQILAMRYPADWPAYKRAVPRFFPNRFTLPSAAGWSLAQWRKNHEFNAWHGALAALVMLRLWWVMGW